MDQEQLDQEIEQALKDRSFREQITNLTVHEGFMYISTENNRIFRRPLQTANLMANSYDWVEIDPPSQLLSTPEPECSHQWVDPINGRVENGMYCTKCGALKAA